MKRNGSISTETIVILSIVASVILIASMMVGLPRYGVYRKSLRGEASLREAEWDRQIAIKEAEAKKESASFEAAAEVIRAEGVALANKIIGDSLQNNEGYLRYLWIQGLHDGNSETVYIATEAGLPIMRPVK